MNKKLIRLTESDLKQIVKESVNKILYEAYGTPSTNDATQLQKADDAQNVFAKYGGGKFKDRNLHALTTIAQVADILHYNSHFLPPKYEEVVERMAEKLKTIRNYLQNNIQMKTGLQPTTWNNFRYNESDLNKNSKKTVNEVMYNGVSYHGTNPYDWVDIKNERDAYGEKFLDAETAAEKKGDTNLANQANQAWEKNYRKVIRDRKNAKALGWQGKGDTRLGKAQEYYNMSQNAQTPQDRQRYNKMAQDTLGDVEGRAQKNLNILRAER